ncbi:MAG: RHS repeat-associated core domain-containing protein [Bacteroidales bacterium]|nr:RHS repeat-associated core domain-containing protein [Bacteroidales bacterium]
MGNDNHSYSNDPIGNRKQSTVYSGQSTVTNVYTANQLNQYTSASFAGSVRNLSHDLDGNLTWDGIHWAHSWDGENRLTSSAPNYWGTTNGATRIDYTYDYMNRRASRTTSMMAGRSISYPPSPTDPQGSWSALEICRYIWDGWNIVAEIIIDQTEFTTNVNYYAWGLDLSGTLQGAGGVGGLLAETKTAESGTNTYYALGGANGNVTEYIDNTGAVKAHYEYNAFGEITAQSGVMADDFAFRFSTKCYDPETGLYYYGHRYYDPILGIWFSKDPVEEQDGPGLYLFLKNDGINKWDYLGRWGRREKYCIPTQKEEWIDDEWIFFGVSPDNQIPGTGIGDVQFSLNFKYIRNFKKKFVCPKEPCAKWSAGIAGYDISHAGVFVSQSAAPGAWPPIIPNIKSVGAFVVDSLGKLISWPTFFVETTQSTVDGLKKSLKPGKEEEGYDVKKPEWPTYRWW